MAIKKILIRKSDSLVVCIKDTSHQFSAYETDSAMFKVIQKDITDSDLLEQADKGFPIISDVSLCDNSLKDSCYKVNDVDNPTLLKKLSYYEVQI